MGLTKPRAAQIYNLDYKQSTRVVTVANVTLSGGAPSTVDGVSLSLNDRILVTAQSTGSQNGLYYVTTVGSGSNGTWARTSDGNETGEIEAGMIVMVTEGTLYADTQWKLITNDPIIINTTALTFTQNYMANSISGGTSNVVVNSNANVTISSAGTANVLLVSSTGTVTSGTASITGNVTSGNLNTTGNVSATGNIAGSGLTASGIVSITGATTFTTSVTMSTAGGNLNIGTSGVTGFLTLGGTTSTSNLTVGRSTLSQQTDIQAGATASGNTKTINFGTGGLANSITNINIGPVAGNSTVQFLSNAQVSIANTGGSALSVAGNVTGGNILTGGAVSASGNVTGSNVLTGGLISATSTITSAANVIGGNLTTGGRVSATANITGGNVLTGGLISATGNITGNYILGNGSQLTGLPATYSNANVATFLAAFGSNTISTTGTINSGNITGGNILTVGQVSATGNVTGNFFVGNGAFLTGLSAGSSNGISNGATSISIPVSSGNITMSVAGASNTVVINLGSLTMYGTFAGPKTLNANVTVANAVNAVIFGPVTIADGFNITVPNASVLYTYSGT